jgi:hypothetical protein
MTDVIEIKTAERLAKLVADMRRTDPDLAAKFMAAIATNDPELAAAIRRAEER